MAVGSRWEQQAKHTQWFLRAWPHLGLLWGCSGTRDVENRIRFPVKDPRLDALVLLSCVCVCVLPPGKLIERRPRRKGCRPASCHLMAVTPSFTWEGKVFVYLTDDPDQRRDQGPTVLLPATVVEPAWLPFWEDITFVGLG